MKSAISLLLIILTLGAATAQDNLPGDTSELLEKLNEYSESERSQAEQRIDEKKSQVVAVLRTHLERETKAGHLDSAVAIQKVIEGLTPAKGSDDATPPPTADPIDTFTALLRSGVWAKKGGNRTIVFREDGKAKDADPDSNSWKRDNATWEVSGDRVFVSEFVGDNGIGELRHKWEVIQVSDKEIRFERVDGIEGAADYASADYEFQPKKE